jgi:large subunit ribosomal protein L22
MRLVADLIRGKRVEKALNILKFSTKEASCQMEKLLLSALDNWQQKNEGDRMEDAQLYVREVHVDGGTMLKRLRTAPQGRGYRIRKRSNHVTLVLDSLVTPFEPEAAEAPEAAAGTEETTEAPATEQPAKKKPAPKKKAAAKKQTTPAGEDTGGEQKD